MNDRMFGAATVSNNPFGRASPILILGIMVMIIPLVAPIFNFNLPFKGFISMLGILLIIAGVIHSAIKE